MADEVEHFETCQDCGATIYPEHLEKRVAEHWEGKLLCPFCLREKRSASGVGVTLPGTNVASAPAGTAEPVALVELESGEAHGVDAPIAYEKKPTVIRSIGGGPGGMPVGHVAEGSYRRPLLTGTPNATRCKTFHCKLADGPIAYMCEQINEWADSDDNIEIKFATSTIGVVEGKHVDPHLIVTVFY
jgi:hypothetical protein